MSIVKLTTAAAAAGEEAKMDGGWRGGENGWRREETLAVLWASEPQLLGRNFCGSVLLLAC
jgi:hypothetical protein